MATAWCPIADYETAPVDLADFCGRFLLKTAWNGVVRGLTPCEKLLKCAVFISILVEQTDS